MDAHTSKIPLPWIPRSSDAESLDRNRCAAAPDYTKRQIVRRLHEMALDVAPHKCAIEQNVRTVRRMNRRGIRPQCCLGVEHVSERLVGYPHELRRIFSQGARIGNDSRHPFAAIACLSHCERIAPHLRRIESIEQRIGGPRQFLAGKYVMGARHRERLACIDAEDARRRMRGRHQRHMQRVLGLDVRCITALPNDEAAILAHAARSRDVARAARRSVHDLPPYVAFA